MIWIFDDVLSNPEKYREAVLSLEFKSFDFGHCVFHGIATGGPCANLLNHLQLKFPALTPTLTFFRKSPKGQVEPHFIHTDVDMGQWSAILYLNPKPEHGDGTAFWTHKVTEQIGSAVPHQYSEEGRDPANFTMRQKVEAKFNRLLVFPSIFFHSRAIAENWGEGDDARLVQVAFGTGEI